MDGCCVDKKCTPQTCMELPKGLTCGHCVHINRCVAIFGHKPEDTVCDWFPRKFKPTEQTKGDKKINVKIHLVRQCAACGAKTQGHYSIHRDGFCIGPEVDLCDECGKDQYPTCGEIWEMIAARRKSFANKKATPAEETTL